MDFLPFLGRAAGVFTLFLPMTRVTGESACPVDVALIISFNPAGVTALFFRD